MSKFLDLKKPNDDTRLNDAIAKTAQDGFKRLSIDMPVSIHKALKQASLDRDMSIKEIVLNAIMKEIKND
jgi:hypothetical protein